jgi:hypothetical protein
VSENFDAYAKAIDGLIELNQSRRKLFNQKDLMFPVEFAQEFCVVRCDIGRRSGKTEYIRSRAKKDDLVIAHSESSLDVSYRDLVCETKSARNLRNLKPKRFNMIFIEEPSFVFDRFSMSDIFGLLVRDADQTFVLLGI